MSGLMNKIKDAVTGEKHTPEAAAANQGNNGEHPILITSRRDNQLTVWQNMALGQATLASVIVVPHTAHMVLPLGLPRVWVTWAAPKSDTILLLAAVTRLAPPLALRARVGQLAIMILQAVALV